MYMKVYDFMNIKELYVYYEPHQYYFKPRSSLKYEGIA